MIRILLLAVISLMACSSSPAQEDKADNRHDVAGWYFKDSYVIHEYKMGKVTCYSLFYKTGNFLSKNDGSFQCIKVSE